MLLFPIVTTLYVYYPILLAEYKYRFGVTTDVSVPISEEFSIQIPVLGINERVIPQVDPFNKTEYMSALNQGIAHANISSLPNESGTSYLFAHSSDNPFSITRYNTSFYLLPNLNPGDEIRIEYQGDTYTYRVTHTQVVKPYQVEALTESTADQLILQTCTPVGTSLNRLLVFAEPIPTSN